MMSDCYPFTKALEYSCSDFRPKTRTIDSIGQLVRIRHECPVMKVEVDPKTQVFISHDWQGMHFAKTCEKYRIWVIMRPSAGKMVAGDAYLFDREIDFIDS